MAAETATLILWQIADKKEHEIDIQITVYIMEQDFWVRTHARTRTAFILSCLFCIFSQRVIYKSKYTATKLL